MKVLIRKTYVTFWRDKDEKRVKNESQMLYWLKLVLNKRGYNLIKKLMYKDGHMVDGLQHYLRARKITGTRLGQLWAIHDPDYAIRDSAHQYNLWQRVTFRVERE